MSRRRSPGGGSRDYPRSARLSQLMREIAGETLERLDDERLGLLTVQDVHVDSELDRAVIHYVQSGQPAGDAEEFDEALDTARRAIKQAFARQAHARRTPDVVLVPDEVIEGATRIDEILRDLREEG